MHFFRTLHIPGTYLSNLQSFNLVSVTCSHEVNIHRKVGEEYL